MKHFSSHRRVANVLRDRLADLLAEAQAGADLYENAKRMLEAAERLFDCEAEIFDMPAETVDAS